MRAPLIAVGLLALTGCATIVEGTSKTITIATNPPTASCAVSRKGEELGRTTPTSQQLTVSKSRNPLTVACTAPGHRSTTVFVDSNVTAAAVASIAFIDLGVVDYATGALNDYPPTVLVSLEPEAPAVAASMAPVK